MPKRSVIPRKVPYHGGEAWRVIIPRELAGGQRKTKFFTTQKEAEACAARLELERLAFRDGFHILDLDEKGVVNNCLKRLDYNVNSLSVAVELYLAQHPSATRKVSDLISECVRAKELSKKADTYIETFACSLKRFSENFGDMDVHLVTPMQIEDWLYSSGRRTATGKIKLWSDETRRWYLKNLRTMFAYGLRRGYLRENPALKVERPMVTEKSPSLFTVAECEKLLHWLRKRDPQLLPYIVLQLFGGLRASEARRIDAAALLSGSIRIDASKSKTRRHRIIQVNDTLRAWLAVAKQGSTTQLRSRMEAAARGAGVKWQRNALRHCFVSFHYAHHQNAALTASLAGHTEQILFSNYRELVSKADAERFWSIMPDTK